MNSLRDAIPARISSDLQKLFPNGVPGVSVVQARIENLSQEELATRFASSVAQLDQERIRSFGARLADYGAAHGIEVPAEVRSGDTRAIGQLLARTAKSEKGINGTLRFLQLATGGGGLTGAAMAMTPFGKMRRLGLLGMLSDPKTRSVVGPLISGLFRKP
ncbi:MAG: hypothetical protein AB7V46_13335 [Thermomicrobiales bacterium]